MSLCIHLNVMTVCTKNIWTMCIYSQVEIFVKLVGSCESCAYTSKSWILLVD